MPFEELNHFQRMEPPEDREAEDLQRAKGEAGFKKKSSGKSVSLRTYKRSTFFVTMLVWALFFAVVAYGAYWALQLFPQK